MTPRIGLSHAIKKEKEKESKRIQLDIQLLHHLNSATTS